MAQVTTSPEMKNYEDKKDIVTLHNKGWVIMIIFTPSVPICYLIQSILSFFKVHFHKMTIKYSNWLVNKIVDKEDEMVVMRKQFLRDNWDRPVEDNYEFKRRDRDD